MKILFLFTLVFAIKSNCTDIAFLQRHKSNQNWLWGSKPRSLLMQTGFSHTYVTEYGPVKFKGITLNKTVSYKPSMFSTLNLTQTVHADSWRKLKTASDLTEIITMLLTQTASYSFFQRKLGKSCIFVHSKPALFFPIIFWKMNSPGLFYGSFWALFCL